MLWSGITHSVLGAPVNSTCYFKKNVNCAIKQSGKSPPQSVVKRVWIHPHGKCRYINALPLPLALINFSDTLIFISSIRNVFFIPRISSLFINPIQNHYKIIWAQGFNVEFYGFYYCSLKDACMPPTWALRSAADKSIEDIAYWPSHQWTLLIVEKPMKVKIAPIGFPSLSFINDPSIFYQFSAWRWDIKAMRLHLLLYIDN